MYQKLVVVGYLGRDPDLRYTPNGKEVVNISVAASRKWKGEGGVEKEETAWFNVEVWGAQGLAVNEHLKKGSRVLVEGRLKPDPRTGGPRVYQKDDGSWGASFRVTAGRVVFLGEGKGKGKGEKDEMPF